MYSAATYVILYEIRWAANVTGLSQYIFGCAAFCSHTINQYQLHESQKMYYIKLYQVLGLCTF